MDRTTNPAAVQNRYHQERENSIDEDRKRWKRRCFKLAAEMHKQRPAITAIFDSEAWELVDALWADHKDEVLKEGEESESGR